MATLYGLCHASLLAKKGYIFYFSKKFEKLWGVGVDFVHLTFIMYLSYFHNAPNLQLNNHEQWILKVQYFLNTKFVNMIKYILYKLIPQYIYIYKIRFRNLNKLKEYLKPYWAVFCHAHHPGFLSQAWPGLERAAAHRPVSQAGWSGPFDIPKH